MDPSKGVVRWAAARSRQHLQAVIPAAFGIPLVAAAAGFFIALPKNPTTAQRTIQAAEALGLGLALVAVLVFLYAIVVAPYEQRNLLRRKAAAIENRYNEALTGVHKSIELAQLKLMRDVVTGSQGLTCGLSFTLEFRNNGEVPIEYRMKRLYLTVDDIKSEIPMDGDISYRIARERSNFFLFTVGLSPMRFGPIKGMVEYVVRYGPVTATEYYTQNYEYFFQDTLNSGGTYSGRFWRTGKGSDVPRPSDGSDIGSDTSHTIAQSDTASTEVHGS
jgi:hypothetical protein